MSYAYGQQQVPPGYQPQGQNPYYPQQPMGSGPPPPQQQQQQYFQQEHFAEGGMPKNEMGFSDVTIRARFVRKVFLMVTLMLSVVAIMTAIPFFHPATMQFVRQTPSLYFLSYFTFLGVYIALMCCESVRRSFPTNLICTGILTLAIGYMTMMITARYNMESVLLCLVITTVCCASIILFSSQTKYDLTGCMGFMFIASMVLLVFGIVAIIASAAFGVGWLYLIYAGLAALLFMFYLAIDIQMLMGGRKVELSPEEHIFASIQIFIDIVYIFWMLLMLFGGSNN
jgi:hypothetical protein